MVKPRHRNYRMGQVMNLKNHIGMKVRFARDRKGWTQERLAEVVGKAVETISNIERGFAYTGLETLERIANALEVPVREFFEEVEERNTLSANRLRLVNRQKELLEQLHDFELEVTNDLMASLIRNRAGSR